MRKTSSDGRVHWKQEQIDWMIKLVPAGSIIFLCILFFILPEQSSMFLSKVRVLSGDTFGIYYLMIDLGIFLFSLFLACSQYGNTVLGGRDEKPEYSFLHGDA